MSSPVVADMFLVPHGEMWLPLCLSSCKNKALHKIRLEKKIEEVGKKSVVL